MRKGRLFSFIRVLHPLPRGNTFGLSPRDEQIDSDRMAEKFRLILYSIHSKASSLALNKWQCVSVGITKHNTVFDFMLLRTQLSTPSSSKRLWSTFENGQKQHHKNRPTKKQEKGPIRNAKKVINYNSDTSQCKTQSVCRAKLR